MSPDPSPGRVPSRRAIANASPRYARLRRGQLFILAMLIASLLVAATLGWRLAGMWGWVGAAFVLALLYTAGFLVLGMHALGQVAQAVAGTRGVACLVCGYDLRTGIDPARCPECGATSRARDRRRAWVSWERRVVPARVHGRRGMLALAAHFTLGRSAFRRRAGRQCR